MFRVWFVLVVVGVVSVEIVRFGLMLMVCWYMLLVLKVLVISLVVFVIVRIC